MNKVLKPLVIFLSIGVLLGLFLAIYSLIKPPQNIRNTVSVSDNEVVPTPTPMPYWNLTIESMKSRSYSSQLNEFDLYRKSSLFNSYLTSYDSDGLKVNGLLTIPNSEKPEKGYPAIVFIHGYIPPKQYRTTEKYVDYVNYFANNGFVVFKIDLRGHGDSEGEAGGAYYSPYYVIDTLNAYKALQASDFVNKDAIGLWGHSMAGNVVARAMAVDAQIPAGVIWAGAVYTYKDMMEFGIGDNSYVPPPTITGRRRTRQEIIDIYGEPNNKSSFWQAMAPANYIKSIGSRIQLHHPVNDNVVSVLYSRNLVNIGKEAGVNVSYFEYETGGHNLTGPTFSKAMQESVKFYNLQFFNQ